MTRNRFICGEAETRNLLPLNADRTGVRMLESDDELQQHALPGAASAEHGERLATNDGQTDVVQHMLCAKRFVNASKHQRRLAGTSRRLSDVIDAVQGDGFRESVASVRLHGKKIRISFTRMTSATITNSDDSTTALVAERPTPSVPPCVRIP